MKIKKNKIVLLSISILLLVGYIIFFVYQLFNGDFDPLILIMLIYVGDAIFNCFEKK